MAPSATSHVILSRECGHDDPLASILFGHLGMPIRHYVLVRGIEPTILRH